MTEYFYDSSGRQFEIVKRTATLVVYRSPGERKSHILGPSQITSSAEVLVSYDWYWQRPVYPADGPMVELRELETAREAARVFYEKACRCVADLSDRIYASEQARLVETGGRAAREVIE